MTRSPEATARVSLDRRDTLRKMVVGGALVWTAPAVMSASVSAADGTCTPKCRVIATAGGLSRSQVVRCIDLPPGAALAVDASVLATNAATRCPCGGSPNVALRGTPTSDSPGSVISGVVVSGTTVSYSISFPPTFSSSIVQVNLPVTIFCLDNAGDECPRDCTLFHNLTITYDGACAGAAVTGRSANRLCVG